MYNESIPALSTPPYPCFPAPVHHCSLQQPTQQPCPKPYLIQNPFRFHHLSPESATSIKHPLRKPTISDSKFIMFLTNAIFPVDPIIFSTQHIVKRLMCEPRTIEAPHLSILLLLLQEPIPITFVIVSNTLCVSTKITKLHLHPCLKPFLNTKHKTPWNHHCQQEPPTPFSPPHAPTHLHCSNITPRTLILQPNSAKEHTRFITQDLLGILSNT